MFSLQIILTLWKFSLNEMQLKSTVVLNMDNCNRIKRTKDKENIAFIQFPKFFWFSLYVTHPPKKERTYENSLWEKSGLEL